MARPCLYGEIGNLRPEDYDTLTPPAPLRSAFSDFARHTSSDWAHYTVELLLCTTDLYWEEYLDLCESA